VPWIKTKKTCFCIYDCLHIRPWALVYAFWCTKITCLFGIKSIYYTVCMGWWSIRLLTFKIWMLCVDGMTFDRCRDDVVSKLRLFWYRNITTVDRFGGATNAICLSLTTPGSYTALRPLGGGVWQGLLLQRDRATRGVSRDLVNCGKTVRKSHFEGLAIGVWLWKERKGRVFI